MDIQVKEEYLKKAMILHQTNPVADAHLDLAGEILLRHKAGEANILNKYYRKNFETAGINLVLSSIYIDDENLYREGFTNVTAQIEAIGMDMESASEKMMLVKSKKDLETAIRINKTGIILYMEGLECIGKDISLLATLYQLGVRGASLTWSRKGVLASGCCRAREHRQIPGGLTEYGIEAVKEMERLGMFLDISHLNDDGFEDICQIADKPFVATHSNSKKVFENYRNLTDLQMEQISHKGGVIGINGCMHIAGSDKGNHLEMLCRHIEYMVKKIGEEHVGYGFDLCDSYDEAEALLQHVLGIFPTKERPVQQWSTNQNDCLLHHGQIPLLTAALLQRGMSQETVIKIIGGNFIRYFKKILPN